MQFDQMRKQGASIFVYLIFCLLIAIFVINFRPGQSRQGDNGCRGATNSAMSVNGDHITLTAYKIAYSTPYNRGSGKQKVYIALETLIRRELLATDAEARGLMVDDDLMNAEIQKGNYFLGGQRTQIPGIFVEIGEGEKPQWNLKAYKNWVGQLNVSPNSYLEEQKRSLLASMMTEILTESVQVSREEALSRFLSEGNTATYDVVAFKPETYRAAMRIGDADVDRFLAGHTDEVQARYKADERTYKAVKPQLKLREIFIAKLEPEVKPADAGSGAKTGDAKTGDDKTGDAKTGDKAADKSAGAKAADAKAGDAKAADKAGDKTAGDKVADAKAGGAKAGDAQANDKSADTKAADKTAGDAKAADAKAGDKAAATKAADKKAGDAKAGEAKAADAKKAGDARTAE